MPTEMHFLSLECELIYVGPVVGTMLHWWVGLVVQTVAHNRLSVLVGGAGSADSCS